MKNCRNNIAQVLINNLSPTTLKILLNIKAIELQDHMSQYLSSVHMKIGNSSRYSNYQSFKTRLKSRQTNLSIIWIDYRKTYDSMSHTWICLVVYKVNKILKIYLKYLHWELNRIMENDTWSQLKTIYISGYQVQYISRWYTIPITLYRSKLPSPSPSQPDNHKKWILIEGYKSSNQPYLSMDDIK